MTASSDPNPLLQDWTTPFGIPPFEAVQPELTTREIAHREQMLAHLAQAARRA